MDHSSSSMLSVQAQRLLDLKIELLKFSTTDHNRLARTSFVQQARSGIRGREAAEGYLVRAYFDHFRSQVSSVHTAALEVINASNPADDLEAILTYIDEKARAFLDLVQGRIRSISPHPFSREEAGVAAVYTKLKDEFDFRAGVAIANRRKGIPTAPFSLNAKVVSSEGRACGPWDVFVSHSSKDYAVARAVAAQLRGDGLQVWFDEWEILPGDSIPAKIEEGLEHSRVLVLCCSANAFGSDWAQLEAGTFRFLDPLNRQHRFIPLRLDDTPFPGSLAQFRHISWFLPNREQEYTTLLEACRPPAPQLKSTEGKPAEVAFRSTST